MANIFTNLPVPAGANGSGAAVDTSGCGGNKFIVVDGSWTLPDRPPTVTIEINNDATPNGTWAPLFSFVGNGKKLITCAARWMRATVSNYRGGTNPTVNFGSTDDPASFVTPAVPAADGVGAATDITALPEIKTITIGDTFTGAVILEYSEDSGGVDWAELPAMWAPGTLTFPLIANWIRVRRQGIPTSATPGTPIVNLGGVAPSGGGGGATDGVNVEKDGVPVLTPALTLNFSGLVQVTDGGSDTADVDIGWNPVDVAADSSHNAAIGDLCLVDPSIDAAVVLPAIAAGNAGQMIAVKAVTFDPDAGGTVTITPTGGDTIDGAASLVVTANRKRYSLILVSDGAGNWDLLAEYQGKPIVNDYTGDGTAPIPISVGDTSAFVAASGAVEGTQNFTLADGKEDGQIITITGLTSGFDLVVTVASPGGGDGGTNTLTAGTPGSMILVWRVDSWFYLSTRGFVNS